MTIADPHDANSVIKSMKQMTKMTWSINLNFIFRMAATLFVQPLDLVKNRMQLSGRLVSFPATITCSLTAFRFMYLNRTWSLIG